MNLGNVRSEQRPRATAWLCAAIALQMVISGIGGCKEVPTNPRAGIDVKRPFVLGILVPNEARAYRQQVFVGKIAPASSSPSVPACADSMLVYMLRQISLRYVATIRGIVEGDSPEDTNDVVRVYLSDESGNQVRLTSIGNGVFEDAGDELPIRAGASYRLTAYFNDMEFTATTTVPGRSALIVPAAGEPWTVTESSDGNGRPVWNGKIDWWESKGAAFYCVRIRDVAGGDERLIHTYALSEVIPFDGVVFPKPSGADVEIRSFDANLANVYQAPSMSSGSDQWREWYDVQRLKAFSARGNATGNVDVLGALGSSNVVRRPVQIP